MICWKYISPLALFIVLIAIIHDLSKGEAAYNAFVGCVQVNFSLFSFLGVCVFSSD